MLPRARKLLVNALARVGIHIERYPPRGSIAGHLMTIFRYLATNTVIDVGANRGQYGLMLRKAGFHGYLVSYEPVPSAFEELAANAHLDHRWTFHKMALSDAPGTMTLNVAEATTVSSFLRPTAAYRSLYSRSRTTHRLEIDVFRLDDVVAAHTSHISEPVIHLKIDTQGLDLKVLAGASELLKTTHSLQIELSIIPIYEGSTHITEALDVIRAHGFYLAGLHPVMVDHALRLYEVDGLFLREDVAQHDRASS